MNFKNVKAERTTVTRNTHSLEEQGTGNLFETLVCIGKRSNQIAVDLKEELNAKLEEFITPTDTLEEIFENREQIEISKFYERLPKPHSVAITELQEEMLHIQQIHLNPVLEEEAPKAEATREEAKAASTKG